jgi:hypothetical protein
VSSGNSSISIARRISFLRKGKHKIVKHAKKHGKPITHKYRTNVTYLKKCKTIRNIYGKYAEQIRTTCGKHMTNIQNIYGTHEQHIRTNSETNTGNIQKIYNTYVTYIKIR